MDTGSFPGVESGRGVTLTSHSLLVPRSKNSRATPLLSLRAFVACKKCGTYLPKYTVWAEYRRFLILKQVAHIIVSAVVKWKYKLS
jgi:hypothetical protein